jgi:hypothetical protein
MGSGGQTSDYGQSGNEGQTGDAQSQTGQDWDQGTTGMEQGDRTDPAQPDGTRPLERDLGTENQNR